MNVVDLVLNLIVTTTNFVMLWEAFPDVKWDVSVVDFKIISSQSLPEEFIREFEDFLDWKTVYSVSPKVVLEYFNKIKPDKFIKKDYTHSFWVPERHESEINIYR
jgi:hypothetical protein